jgi:hypothetical protein
MKKKKDENWLTDERSLVQTMSSKQTTQPPRNVYSTAERNDLIDMLMEMGSWSREQVVRAVEKSHGDPEDAMDILLTEQLNQVEANEEEVVQSKQTAAVPPQVSRTMRNNDQARPARLSKQDSLKKLYNIASKRTQQRESDALVNRLRTALKLPADPGRTSTTMADVEKEKQQAPRK